jgi:glycosidase
MRRIFLLSFVLIFLLLSETFAEPKLQIERLEPSSWWCNMKYNSVELLVSGKGVSECEVSIKSEDLSIKSSKKVSNPDYLFIELEISANAKPGIYPLIFKNTRGKTTTFPFELRERNNFSERYQGFNSSDVIYLLMPDRFSNGNPDNDSSPEMIEKSDRQIPYGRHGGDIKGISNHLDYISGLGFTSIWINPLLENNMPEYSYHGYGITDFYKIDQRFGSNMDYVNLVDSAHKQGLKVIADMVMNHCGTNHWFVLNPPSNDWLNNWGQMTWSNFRGEVMTDPYAAESDKTRMEKGWFAATLADLNLSNPFLLRYLIQNTIWWIEYAGIDGIRMDTYPYPNKNAMVQWAKAIREEYPTLTIVGETWLQKTSHTAYWQSGSDNYDEFDSNIPVVTDFPLYYAIGQSMNETAGWSEGLRRLYYVMTEDYLYDNPLNLLTFADNHDLERFYTTMKEDLNKYKLGLAFLLTARGIPQIYYGTEVLMTGEKKVNDGYIRCDLPGGWAGDSVNVFTGVGLTSKQKEASEFLQKLLLWRKECSAIHMGKTLHFIPDDDLYVYFRYTDDQSVMVILNKNPEDKNINSERYAEGLRNYTYAKNILTGELITKLDTLKVPAMSPLILELSGKF